MMAPRFEGFDFPTADLPTAGHRRVAEDAVGEDVAVGDAIKEAAVPTVAGRGRADDAVVGLAVGVPVAGDRDVTGDAVCLDVVGDAVPEAPVPLEVAAAVGPDDAHV